MTVDADATDTLSVTCEMTRIPADKVTDEMLKGIVDQTKDAVENGDETLKGDAGKDILDKLEGNVANNPNASDETKQEATDADKEVDVDSKPEATTPSGDNGNTSDKGNANSNSGSNAGNSGSNGNGSSTSGGSSSGSSSKPSAPAHSHSWKDHTATKQVWVPNIVTVTDYADLNGLPVLRLRSDPLTHTVATQTPSEQSGGVFFYRMRRSRIKGGIIHSVHSRRAEFLRILRQK